MKHFTIFLAIVFTACLSQAQTTFKTDTAAIKFAQTVSTLYGVQPFTADSTNCKNCLDVQLMTIRVQFWKQANGYSLASITGNEKEMKHIWQTVFGGDATKNVLQLDKQVLTIGKTGNKYRLQVRANN